jgi:hypothetical protein
LAGLFRQSVFGRLAGYEDVNDAERLRHDPAMRWIVGGKAAQGCAASPSQMGRFETQWLAAPANLSALADLSMAAKIARLAPQPPFGLPEVPWAIRALRVSCQKVGKTRKLTSSGVIWGVSVYYPNVAIARSRLPMANKHT